MYSKKFDEWNVLKKHINEFEKTPIIKVGSEIDGKNELFHRPVLILKKLSHDLCLVAPITSKLKAGSWYVDVLYHEEHRTVCLHQVTVINTKRLGKHIVRPSPFNFSKVTERFASVYSFT